MPVELEDAVRDLEVLELLAADVVDLARLALVQDELDGGAVVVRVQPLADLLAVAVDRAASSPSSAFVTKSGIIFSGYWCEP